MTVCYCSRLNINVLRPNFTLAVIFFAFLNTFYMAVFQKIADLG